VTAKFGETDTCSGSSPRIRSELHNPEPLKTQGLVSSYPIYETSSSSCAYPGLMTVNNNS
jgi:hypothetical protein